MKSQKGFVQILLVLGIVAAIGVIGFVFYRQNLLSKQKASVSIPSAASKVQYSEGQNSVPQIKNTTDLNKASASLDSANTGQIDAQLNALNSASSGF